METPTPAPDCCAETPQRTRKRTRKRHGMPCDGDGAPSECPICFDPLQPAVRGRSVITLPCKHKLHWSCWTSWTAKSTDPTCPMCRQLAPTSGPQELQRLERWLRDVSPASPEPHHNPLQEPPLPAKEPLLPGTGGEPSDDSSRTEVYEAIAGLYAEDTAYMQDFLEALARRLPMFRSSSGHSFELCSICVCEGEGEALDAEGGSGRLVYRIEVRDVHADWYATDADTRLSQLFGGVFAWPDVDAFFDPPMLPPPPSAHEDDSERWADIQNAFFHRLREGLTELVCCVEQTATRHYPLGVVRGFVPCVYVMDASPNGDLIVRHVSSVQIETAGDLLGEGFSLAADKFVLGAIARVLRQNPTHPCKKWLDDVLCLVREEDVHTADAFSADTARLLERYRECATRWADVTRRLAMRTLRPFSGVSMGRPGLQHMAKNLTVF
jgi:hypothetical protein